MIGVFFSVSSVGYFALAYRIVMLPASLFGVSIGQAFFSEITKDGSDTAALTFNTISKATFFIPFSIDLFAISLPTLSANSFLVNFSVINFRNSKD